MFQRSFLFHAIPDAKPLHTFAGIALATSDASSLFPRSGPQTIKVWRSPALPQSARYQAQSRQRDSSLSRPVG
ncbi:hypothetical protein EHI45_14735 [Rhizobium leguminosarum]|nr:hypothetical protein EHI45_14735 [Rhizobium leguminosarum]